MGQLKNVQYARGPYNKCNDQEQWIRISEGCPNNCPYCRETKECGTEPIYLPIPKIVRNKVKILDMNLIYKPKAVEIIKYLGLKKVNNRVVYYELICGIDYRFLTKEIAEALKTSRFQNLRLAWDWYYSSQRQIKNSIQFLLKAGYTSKDITIFMICNWKIPYNECLKKLNLCKYWNIKVADCYFDNQLSPNIKPEFWTTEEIKFFRKKIRKHNQICNFKIDPEFKKENQGVLM